MLRHWLAFISCIFGTLVPIGAPTALAQERIALIIGNAAYQELPLKNPVNDARAMASRLEKLGFEVIKLENAGRGAMEDAIADFEERLGPGKAGLFYYAGHGLQVRGQNYLVPVDAVIESESRVRTQAVPLSHVTSAMNYAESRINFILLDACRNNPFERSMRGGSRGLAAVDAAAGTLVFFRGRNSMHRVAPNEGARTRMLAVLAYNSKPGVALSETARMTFYGRSG